MTWDLQLRRPALVLVLVPVLVLLCIVLAAVVHVLLLAGVCPLRDLAFAPVRGEAAAALALRSSSHGPPAKADTSGAGGGEEEGGGASAGGSGARLLLRERGADAGTGPAAALEGGIASVTTASGELASDRPQPFRAVRR